MQYTFIRFTSFADKSCIFFFWAQASGRARPSFTSIALDDVDEGSDDATHQREVIQDTAGVVFVGTY